MRIIGLALVGLSLIACSGINFSQWHFPYMMQVQQGAYITNNQFNQIKIGMTKDQVAFILGHPLTQYMFDQQRWDFMYQKYNNNILLKSYNITIYFDKANKVYNITKDGELFNK